MRLNRELQLDVLRALRDAYPSGAGDLPHAEDPNFPGNLWYLREHGLITAKSARPPHVYFFDCTITARGLDLLEDDGGLSAILGTITVKIDPDNLRSLMATQIEASELPADERSRVAQAMRSLPAQALQDLTTRIVNDAVSGWPRAIQLIQLFAGP